MSSKKSTSSQLNLLSFDSLSNQHPNSGSISKKMGDTEAEGEEKKEVSKEGQAEYQEKLDLILQDDSEFRVRLEHFKCIGLTAKDKNGLSDPYLKGSLDQFRTFRTDVIEKNLNPVWSGYDVKLVYLTKYPDCLSVKKLELEVWDKDVLAKDDLIGKCSVDLYTLATGPEHHELQLYEDEGRSIKAGLIHFDCILDFIREVHLSFGNVRFSELTYGESGGDNAPTAYMSYNTANLNNDKKYKTETLPGCYTPYFEKTPTIIAKFTLRELLEDGIELRVRHEKTGMDPLLGRVTFAFKKYWGEEPPKEGEWYQFKEDVEDDKHQNLG